MTHCETKARANLNAQQWAELARQDRLKADHSAKRAERYARALAIHLQDCPSCPSPQHYEVSLA